LAIDGDTVYCGGNGWNAHDQILRLDISNPSRVRLLGTLPIKYYLEHLEVMNNHLLTVEGAGGLRARQTGNEAPVRGRFRRVGSVACNTGENLLTSADIDVADGWAFFGTYTNPAKIVKIKLGEGAAAPQRLDGLTLDPSDGGYLRCGVVDDVGGYGYFAPAVSPGKIVKFHLGSNTATMRKIGTLVLASNEDYPRTAVVDPVYRYAYFGMNTVSGGVVKVKLTTGDTLPVRIGHAPVQGNEWNLASSVLDMVHGFAYFGTARVNSAGPTPAHVIKINLGVGDTAPSYIGNTALSGAEDSLWNGAMIDPESGHAWWITNTPSRKVVKTRLFADNTLPLRLNALDLKLDGSSPGAAVIDQVNRYAYVADNGWPATITQVDLGNGDAAPTKVASITLNAGEGNVQSAVIDTMRGYAYFGCATSPGIVVKVELSARSSRTGVSNWWLY
jgi:hypothetical protein